MSKTIEPLAETAAETPDKPKRRRGKKGDEPPIATEKHTVVKEWIARTPVEPVRPAPPPEPVIAEDDEEEFSEDELEDAPDLEEKVDRYFMQLANETPVYTAVVYRLPFYHVNQRTDGRSGRIHCGTVPFDPDTFEDEIRSRFFRPELANVFYAEVRKDKSYFRALPVITLENPAESAPSVAAPVAPMPSVNPVAPVVAPASAADSLERELASFERFLSLAAKLSRLSAPAVPVPAPMPAPEISEEAAIVRFLMGGEETAEKLRQSALAKIFGAEVASKPSEPSTFELISEGLKHGPAIIAAIFDNLARFRGQSSPAQPAPSMPELVPAQPAAPDPLMAYNQLFNQKLFPLLQQNGSVKEAAHALQAFIVQFPQFEQAIIGFVGQPVPELLGILAQIPEAAPLAQLPHAAAWLEALRAELIEDEGESDVFNSNPGSPANAA